MDSTSKILLAFVGMPGSGKSEASGYCRKKGIPVVRFGDLTDERLKKERLQQTPENEQIIREKLRNTQNMTAYAQHALPKIQEFFKSANIVAIDGLYSWEEYIFLKNIYPQIIVIHVYADKSIRYQRLAARPIRSLTKEQAQKRDIDEIEKLNKGGPIAIADYMVNSNGSLNDLYNQIDTLLNAYI